jgi:inner membrane protein
MSRLINAKFITIGLLVFLFLIGLGMLSHLVSERQQYNDQVQQSIGKEHVNPQTLIAPFIVIPGSTTIVCANDTSKNCQHDENIIITSSTSDWHHNMLVSGQTHKHGIYKVITYSDGLTINGKFDLPKELTSPAPNQVIHWEQAKLRMTISDLRGLGNQPVLTIAGRKTTLEIPHVTGVNPLDMSYVEAPITINPLAPSVDFNLGFSLNGMSGISVIPAGQNMTVAMNANWSDPHFYGAALPKSTIQPKLFSAAWESTYIANQNTNLLTGCLTTGSPEDCRELKNIDNSAFAVKLIDAVNIYTMTDRTIKYALLFLLITFGTFFLFEVLKKLQIHPVQYTLVAAALGVFYLLLISFSEHVGFGIAYLGSSIACVSLISFYVYYVLKGLGRTLVLSTVLSSMYGALYVILQSEDLTLILGSVLVFVLLAVTMFLTRNVNWYDTAETPSAEQPQSADASL